MAKAKQEEENHWPGFVDALSTIVMVVTFLLIILAVVIFAMSLRVADIAATQSTETTATNMEEAYEYAVAENPIATTPEKTQTEIKQTQKKLVLNFADTTVELDEGTKSKINEYFVRNKLYSKKMRVVVVGYHDAAGGAYTKAQRLAYYRTLSVRNTIITNGVDPLEVKLAVEEAPTPSYGNRVEIYGIPHAQ